MRRRAGLGHFKFFIFNFELFEPFAETAEAVVRTRNDLDADDGANLRGGGGSGIGGGFHSGDVATEKHGDVSAADFFPAGDVDVCGLERGIGGLNGGAETFTFNHSNSLL